MDAATSSSTATTQTASRLRAYAYMRLARALDERFGSLLLTGRVAKWYSQIGTEATSVAAGLALEAGDTLCSLHRDLGAILAVYLDPARAVRLDILPRQQPHRAAKPAAASKPLAAEGKGQ